MARKIKIGLDYFPHNCSLDDSISYIIALHKEKGYYVYFRLLEHMYSQEGYYCNWDKKNIVLFSSKINISVDELNEIIKDCLDEGLFKKSIFNKFKILTSKGIQERYFEAIDRRKEANIINDYNLMNNVYINGLNVNINYLNVDKSTQSKVKESKVNKSTFLYSEFYDEQLKTVSNETEYKQYEKFIKILFGANAENEKLNKVLALEKQVTHKQFLNLLKKKPENKTFTFVLEQLEFGANQKGKSHLAGKKSLSGIFTTWFRNDF